MTETQTEPQSTTESSEETQAAATTSEGTPALRDPGSSEPTGSEQEQGGETSDATESQSRAEADAWEGFELKGPEGHDAETLTAFGKAMQAQGMTPDGAQKALDELLPVIQERQMAGLNKLHEQWQEACKKDAVLGGDKFEENMATARIGADKFGDEELWTLLKPVSEGGQGLGNNPAISRLLFRVAKAIVPESQIVTGQAIEPERDEMEVEYPVMARQLREKGLR